MKSFLFRRAAHLMGRFSLIGFCATAVYADTGAIGLSLNSLGMPGYFELPHAQSLPDGEIVTSVSFAAAQRSVTLAFQATPRITAAFRYGRFEGVAVPVLYDRSFDLQYRIVDEGKYWPAVAIGLRDFVGTGVNSAEYFVATRQITSAIQVTAGLGWGHLGSWGGISSPFGWNRRVMNVGLGGRPEAASWFHGPVAPFAAIAWRPSERLSFALEYSSDAHAEEVESGALDFRTPFNFGASYSITPDMTLSARLMHGSAFGLMFKVALNPKSPPAGGDLSTAPPPFVPQVDLSLQGMDEGVVMAKMATALRAQGLTLVNFKLSQDAITVAVRNDSYPVVAQMVGRTARVLAASLPEKVNRFEVEPIIMGMATSKITVWRKDLEAQQYDPEQTRISLDQATFAPGGDSKEMSQLSTDPFRWSVSPYASLALFDPVSPLRGDLGLQIAADYDFNQKLSLSGAIHLKAFGNEGASGRISNSALPHVRSDAPVYARNGASGVENLTLDQFGKIGPSFYGHLSIGYLEAMYAGAVGEVLWQPVNSRIQMGVELDRVFQRDTNKLFGIGDYRYAVTLGHASVYYQPIDGLDMQLDVGRYLAGDWGSTLTISRAFANGWRIGTFATLTNVSFRQFGEGSFDKGFVITAPLSWFTGRPAIKRADIELRPIQRDGGAQLDIRNRLHDLMRGYTQPEMARSWGAFWR